MSGIEVAKSLQLITDNFAPTLFKYDSGSTIYEKEEKKETLNQGSNYI